MDILLKKRFVYKSKFSSVNETKYFFCTADDLIKTLHGIHKHSFMHHIYYKDNFQNTSLYNLFEEQTQTLLHAKKLNSYEQK